MGWRRARGRADQLAVETVDTLPSSRRRRLADAQHVRAERLHGVQPFDLYQAGQKVRDAVARRAHSLEELQAVAHAADLVPLQPEALGQVPPRLHHGRLAAVGGAEHAAGLLQAVEWKFRWAQSWGDVSDSTWLTATGFDRRHDLKRTLCNIAGSGIKIQDLPPATLQHLCGKFIRTINNSVRTNLLFALFMSHPRYFSAAVDGVHAADVVGAGDVVDARVVALGTGDDGAAFVTVHQAQREQAGVGFGPQIEETRAGLAAPGRDLLVGRGLLVAVHAAAQQLLVL